MSGLFLPQSLPRNKIDLLGDITILHLSLLMFPLMRLSAIISSTFPNVNITYMSVSYIKPALVILLKLKIATGSSVIALSRFLLCDKTNYTSRFLLTSHMQTLQHKILIWSHYAALPNSAKFCLQCYGSLNNNARPDKLCIRLLGELTKRTVKMEINMLIYHFMIPQN